MKNGLPYPSRFSINLLAEHWDCASELVNTYIKDGLLKAETPPTPPVGLKFIDRRYVTKEEVLRFESEHPTPHHSATLGYKNNQIPQIKPENNLLKTLVFNAASNLKKDSGKFPSYKVVFGRLCEMVQSEDQANAIIKNVSIHKGITIVGRDEPIAVKTIKNWLTAFKKIMSDPI